MFRKCNKMQSEGYYTDHRLTWMPEIEIHFATPLLPCHTHMQNRLNQIPLLSPHQIPLLSPHQLPFPPPLQIPFSPLIRFPFSPLIRFPFSPLIRFPFPPL